MMGRVEYDDREAVLLVYSLYMKSKENGCTLEELQQLLQEKENREPYHREEKTKSNKEFTEQSNTLNVTSKEDANIIEEVKLPFISQKSEKEEEVLYYPVTSYIIAGALGIVGGIMLFMSFFYKIVYNSLGTGIDFIKLVALLSIIGAPIGYALLKLFSKDKKLSKIVTKVEYTQVKESDLYLEEEVEAATYTAASIESEDYWDTWSGHEEEDEKTTILTLVSKSNFDQLIPVQKEMYDTIVIKEYPFFIGTMKNKMQYSLQSSVISRYHAKLEQEGEAYYLSDLNSTNGTYVNGKKLNGYERVRIYPKDEFTFANISYIFSCS